MKKILFLIPAFLLAFQISKAQTEKGSQTLGVDLSFGYAKQSNPYLNNTTNLFSNSDDKHVTYSVGPTYSYFIADKLDIGGSVFYSNSKNDYGVDNSTTRYHSYGASVMLRKYWMLSQSFGFRAGPQFVYQHAVQNTSGGIYSQDGSSNSYTGSANAGIVYYPVKRFGLSVNLASLNYTHTSNSYTNGSHGKSDNVSFSWINSNVGISTFFVFGGK